MGFLEHLYRRLGKNSDNLNSSTQYKQLAGGEAEAVLR